MDPIAFYSGVSFHRRIFMQGKEPCQKGILTIFETFSFRITAHVIDNKTFLFFY